MIIKCMICGYPTEMGQACSRCTENSEMQKCIGTDKMIHPKDTHAAFPRRMSDPKKKYFSKEPEDHLQTKCELELYRRGLYFIHIPDKLYNFIFSKKLKMFLCYGNKYLYNWLMGVMGLVSKYFLGFPDLVIFHNGRYLAVELKTKTNMRQGQKKVRKRIGTHEVREYETFIKLVDDFESNAVSTNA